MADRQEPAEPDAHPLPRLYLCTGSDCKRNKQAFRALAGLLDQKAHVTEVDCQKICNGPVCGLVVEGQVEWFSDLATDKARAGLLAFLQGEPMARALKNRWESKRAGKIR